MKVNESNLQGAAGLGSTGAAKAVQGGRLAGSGGEAGAAVGDGSDGVALSGLAQTLRALDVESPEREARVEQLARAYAEGGYKVDAEAVAGGVIDDALKNR